MAGARAPTGDWLVLRP